MITAVPAATLRDRVKKGDCDLWIGQLAAPVNAASAWWGAAFAAGADTWAEQRLAAGAIDNAAAERAFADRLPIVPLLFRAVRMWHRSDVRGLGVRRQRPPELRGHVPVRRPRARRARRQAVKLRGRSSR